MEQLEGSAALLADSAADVDVRCRDAGEVEAPGNVPEAVEERQRDRTTQQGTVRDPVRTVAKKAIDLANTIIEGMPYMEVYGSEAFQLHMRQRDLQVSLEEGRHGAAVLRAAARRLARRCARFLSDRNRPVRESVSLHSAA